MAARKKYIKKPTSFVIAVQLDLDTEGFTYNKWGGKQVCKRGDWLVDNDGDKYTVSQKKFAETYERISLGVYAKSTSVWAEVADKPGKIKTNEGETTYQAGDYLVYNNEDGTDADAYATSAEKFRKMYNPAEE